MAKAKATKRSARGAAGTIATQLAVIDRLIRAKLAGLASSLAPPAKPATIDKLGKLFGGEVPADVRAWFAWHDGQRSELADALIPDTSWSALSCKDVAEIHAFLCGQPTDEIMQPWRPQWIPMFANGGGDHLCYDRESGALIVFWHDDKARPRDFKSLGALVAAMEKAYAKMKAPKTFPLPAIKKWTRVTLPVRESFDALPIGTAYAYFARLTMGPRHFIQVKLGEDRWLDLCSGSLDAALRDWRAFAKKPPAESSGYYSDNNNTYFSLTQRGKVLKQGMP